MRRSVVIVADSAGAAEPADEILIRAGYAPPERVPTLGRALQRMRERSVDLLVVPLDGPEAADLTLLASEVGRTSTMVIATAARSEPDLILRAMRAGVHEFLVAPPSAEELSGAVERLVRRVQAESTPRLTVAVYSAKGGLGTSTVAVNLAWQFATLGKGGRTALADFVVSGGDVGVMLNLKPTFDIGDVALKVSQLDSSLLESVLVSGPGGVRVLAASERPETLEMVDGNVANLVLSQLNAAYSYTVVDTEHHLTDRTLSALDAADKVVLVLQLNVAAVRSAQRTVTLCRRLGFTDDKLVLVVNRFQPGDLLSVDDAARVLDHPIAVRIPNDYRASEAALTRGVPVSEYADDTPMARAYAELARLLAGMQAPTPTAQRDRNGQGSRFGRLLGIGRK
jgi:pilus assembly protein CpaE